MNSSNKPKNEWTNYRYGKEMENTFKSLLSNLKKEI